MSGDHFFLLGHTHICDSEWVDGIHYVNTGCWVEAACTYVLAHDDRVRVCQRSGTDLDVVDDFALRVSGAEHALAQAS